MNGYYNRGNRANRRDRDRDVNLSHLEPEYIHSPGEPSRFFGQCPFEQCPAVILKYAKILEFIL